ncbi:PH domain-containing protein [Microbacterium sp. B2969]|uniref:PH domain-containing protein n=1 Tax=Microbacterium alkaliflavum TaxID=3248839 RepID=A0ABW7Q7N1_9MICO
MTQPATFGGRPRTPAPGVPTPELRVARFRSHARRLVWPSLVLVVVAGAVGYFYGNLPAPLHNWMLLTAAAVVLFFLALWPFLAWWAHTWTITTRRVIERSGVIVPRRRELTHVRGYAIRLDRGPIQRMWGAGTLTLSNGVDEPMRLVNVPSVDLVHECLVDQVEVNQILAHRELPLPQAPAAPPAPPAP